MNKILQQVQKAIEILAYLVALWSLLVLFLEPVISYYANFVKVENFTAWANLLLLALAIINRLLLKEGKGISGAIIFDIIMLVVGLFILVYTAKFVIFLLLIRQTYYFLQFILFRFSEGKIYLWLSTNPPVTLLLSFLLVIFLGTILLMLPVSSNNNRVTPFVDALFTATSATCVTGLTVLPTGSHFSLFGQIVILLLIQTGGLGIMTLSTAFALLLGRSINLKLKNVMINVMGGTTRINIFQLLKNIVIATAIIEACGAIILLTKFAQDFPIREAIYYSIFHSISAFCNAGFSPFDSNLMMYSDSIIISLGIPLLIFFGGLGFTVILDLYRYFFKPQKVRKLSLHSKIVLTTTAILIVIGLVAFFILEYNNTMKGFSFKHRFLASLFQSVTPRTAGFNTIDNGILTNGSVLMTIVLMFIGASPGSTGGGIKTTTLAILSFAIISMLKGKKDISVFKRRIPNDNFREASGLVFLAATFIFVIVMILLIIEPFRFEDIIFEAISAFGTVGLSRGITPFLSSQGKILITLLMYIGRVGPLTLIYAFAKKKNYSNINYAEESIAIG